VSAPRFVVVGHVNRGKSSVVSTLAADETVRIDETPGTTRHCREFPMRVDGETLYILIDTPGFERARHALEWLRSHETGTGERREVVQKFVDAHGGSGSFEQECELLRPILDGASILYVVDGSVPFSPAYEAETEILRWTGQPRMALINPIGEDDYIDQWRRVLDQYFSLVRVFDAHQASFERRIELLRALRELSQEDAIDRAIQALIDDRAHTKREAAALLADALVDMLTRVERERLPAGADPEPHREPLAQRLFAQLRRRELRLRSDLQDAYRHTGLEVAQASTQADPALEADLFDTRTWSRLGLGRTQLLASGAVAGATVGLGVDAALGGASVLLGTAIGGLVGAATSWLAWDRLVQTSVLGAPLAGVELRCGPVAAPNFAWVLLDRALLFQEALAGRAHARRTSIELDEAASRVRALDPETRKPIEACFGELRKLPAEPQQRYLRGRLTELVEPLLA
jgi:GTPase Era involved in 16S rRNA processing